MEVLISLGQIRTRLVKLTLHSHKGKRVSWDNLRDAIREFLPLGKLSGQAVTFEQFNSLVLGFLKPFIGHT